MRALPEARNFTSVDLRILVSLARDEAVPDPDVFAHFCNARPALNSAIVATMNWQVAKQEKAQRAKEATTRQKEWQARREQERIQREQDKLRWVQEQAHLREQAAKRKKYNAERRAEEMKRAAHENAMRQACLAKTRASGKERVMTAEEKKWYIKEFGKQPPRGC